MLPSGLVELVDEVALAPPLSSAIELSMNDEMMDCGDWALVEVVELEAVPAELDVVPAKEEIKFWNADVRVDVILPEALEPPYKLVSNSLLPDSVARLVSAATVDATLEGELAADFGVVFVLAAVPAVVAAYWLPPTLPIDIMSPRLRLLDQGLSADTART